MATASNGPSGDLTSQILLALSVKEPVLSAEYFPEFQFADLKAALDRLASRSMVKYESIEREEAVLEAEGKQIAEHGSHEARVFEAVRKALEGLTIQELEAAIGDKNVTKLGQGKAFKNKWVKKEATGKLVATVSVFCIKLSKSPGANSAFTDRVDPRRDPDPTQGDPGEAHP